MSALFRVTDACSRSLDRLESGLIPEKAEMKDSSIWEEIEGGYTSA